MRLLLLLFIIINSPLSAQLNTTLRDQLEYADNVNDIWGYVAPDGTEYAIVGLNTGVSFVSLADPDSIVEVAFVAGQKSEWRDMKTFGQFAYSVADQRTSFEGITSFDLRNLPDSVPVTRNSYQVPNSTSVFDRSHNLYIDTTTGILYTAGGKGSIRNGGILMFDLTEDPMNPVLTAVGPEIYSHDVYVHDGIMYASEIFEGDLALYDVSDLDSIVELGRTETPFSFTHNAWSDAAGDYVFTTDEKGNASVAAYDVRTATDIKLIDEYRPATSLNSGTIPHNVHLIDDYLSTSYYTDGLRVVDASVPDNLVEVANYDTWRGEDGNFNGAWGAYPFLPSGLTLVSDRQSGLFVVDVDYKRAGRLFGTITDEVDGTAINSAVVTVSSPEARVSTTDALGDYKTGVADGGTYIVTIRAEGYDSLTFEQVLTNGENLRLDTFLLKSTTATQYDFTTGTRGNVFPNPSGGAFNFSYETPSGIDFIDLRVMDATGRLVEGNSLLGGAATVQFGSDLPPGLYFIELLAGGRRLWWSKVIKE